MLEGQGTRSSRVRPLTAVYSHAQGADIPIPSQSQSYITNPRGQETSVQLKARNEEKYEFTTRVEGKFARDMSSIPCEPIVNAAGSGGQANCLGNNFYQEVQQALAIKLNLKTPQHAG